LEHISNYIGGTGKGKVGRVLNLSTTLWRRIMYLTKHYALKTYGGVDV